MNQERIDEVRDLFTHQIEEHKASNETYGLCDIMEIDLLGHLSNPEIFILEAKIDANTPPRKNGMAYKPSRDYYKHTESRQAIASRDLDAFYSLRLELLQIILPAN